MRNTPTPWYKFNPPTCAADALKFGPICWPLTKAEADRRGCGYTAWFDWMPATQWTGYVKERPLPDHQLVRSFWQSSFDFTAVPA